MSVPSAPGMMRHRSISPYNADRVLLGGRQRLRRSAGFRLARGLRRVRCTGVTALIRFAAPSSAGFPTRSPSYGARQDSEPPRERGAGTAARREAPERARLRRAVDRAERGASRVATRERDSTRLLRGRRCLVGTLLAGRAARSLFNGACRRGQRDARRAMDRAPFGADPRRAPVWTGRLRHERRNRGDASRRRGRLAAGPVTRPVVYQSVIEEDAAETARSRRASRGRRADGVVIAEPTNDGFDLAAVGVIWARITFEARSRHASHADARLEPHRGRLRRGRGAARTRGGAEQRHPEPEFEGVERPYLLNVGALHAGDWPSMTPGKAELDVRSGFRSGWSPKARRGYSRRSKGSSGGPRSSSGESAARGYAFDQHTSLVALLSDCHKAVHGRRPSRSLPGRRPTCDSSRRRLGPGQAV